MKLTRRFGLPTDIFGDDGGLAGGRHGHGVPGRAE